LWTPELTDRGYDFKGDDETSAFNLKAAHFDNSELRAKLYYNGENFGGLLRFLLDGKTLGSSTAISVNDLIDIYYAWVKIPVWSELYVKLWTGNDSQRGLISRYADFDDFVRAKIDNFGPISVSYDYDTNEIEHATSDITNMQKDALGGAAPAFIAQVGWKPVVLSFSTSQLYYTIHNARTNSFTGGDYDDVASNFALSLEGEKLFDWVTLAGIYKYLAADRNFTQKEAGGLDPEKVWGGQGLTYHQFGFFATVTPPMLEGLGATVGYSALVKQQEDGWQRIVTSGVNSWIPASHQYPVNHGIDLRLQYADIPVLAGLTVTSNHNISFASVSGDDDPETLIWGFYNEDVPVYTTEGSFGLYNSLAVSCKVLDGLTVHAQGANRYLQTYYNYDDATRFIDTYNIFSLYLGASWQINQMVSLRGGFVMRYLDRGTASSAREADAGTHELGIPLALKIVF
jgi:hypothetical protein